MSLHNQLLVSSFSKARNSPCGENPEVPPPTCFALIGDVYSKDKATSWPWSLSE